MYQVYKIDEKQLPAAAGRTVQTAAKLMLAVYVLFCLYFMLSLKLGIRYLLIGSVVVIPAYGLALLLGYTLLKQTYRHYRIILTDAHIQFIMPRNEKRIELGNLLIVKRSNRITEIRDKNVPAFSRWMTGEGSIKLLPEIEHFDKLIAAIKNYQL